MGSEFTIDAANPALWPSTSLHAVYFRDPDGSLLEFMSYA